MAVPDTMDMRSITHVVKSICGRDARSQAMSELRCSFGSKGCIQDATAGSTPTAWRLDVKKTQSALCSLYGMASKQPCMLLSLKYRYIVSQDDRWLNSEGDMHASMFNPGRLLTEEGQKPASLVPFVMEPQTCPGSVLSVAELGVLHCLGTPL